MEFGLFLLNFSYLQDTKFVLMFMWNTENMLFLLWHPLDVAYVTRTIH